MSGIKKRVLVSILAILFVFSLFAYVKSGKTNSSFANTSFESHLLFKEDFDSLSNIDEKFTNVGDDAAGKVTLVSGGVKSSGKRAKIEKWALAHASVPKMSSAKELTISAWVYSENPEQRIFSVQSGYNWFMKGGGISNDDHTVVAWPNVEGRAVVTNDDPWGHSWGAGIYNKDTNGNASNDFYLFTVSIDKESVKFYKNNLLIDSYYVSNDRDSHDVQSFIDSFYQGMKSNKIGIGGGAFLPENTGVYYIDNLRVYDFAVRTYPELYQVINNSGSGMDAKYTSIVSGSAIGTGSNTDPVVFYDFSSVSGTTVNNNGGTRTTNANATLNGGTVTDGKLVLDGSGYLKLPDNLFSGNAYSVSMDVKRDTLWNNDVLFTLTNGWYDDLVFADCWIKNATDDGTIPLTWLITDHWNTAKNNSYWKNTPMPSTREWFNVTVTYANGNLKIYIDGVLMNEVAMSGAVSPANFNEGYIGGRDFWDRACFRGEIDNVAVYDYALPQESAIYLGNRTTVKIDMPSNATSSTNALNYLKTQFAKTKDNAFTFTNAQISALGINYSNKTPQTFKIKQGLTAKVYFRDIQNKTLNLNYKATDVLPDEVSISYSDGTSELLAVTWATPYEFGGANVYTGTVKDDMGRTATVTANMTYTADKTALKELIDKAASVIDCKPLYDIFDYNAFYNAVNGDYESAKAVYNKSGATNAEILEVSKNLGNAINSVTMPERNSAYELFTVNISGYTDWYRAEIHATETDLIAIKPSGIEMQYYTAEGLVTKKAAATVSNGNYKLVIGRELVYSYQTAVVNVYLYKNNTLVTKLESVISDNFGAGTVNNSTYIDLSLLAFYTSINKNQYDSSSVSRYESKLTETGVKTDVADWSKLSESEINTMTANAKSAFDLLVAAKISSVEQFSDITCKVGTDVSSLLPTVANVTYTNGRVATARVTWDLSALDTSTAGEVILNGKVPDTDGTYFNVTLKIIVSDNKADDGADGENQGKKGAGVNKTIIVIVAGVVGVGVIVGLMALITVKQLKKRNALINGGKKETAEIGDKTEKDGKNGK